MKKGIVKDVKDENGNSYYIDNIGHNQEVMDYYFPYTKQFIKITDSLPRNNNINSPIKNNVVPVNPYAPFNLPSPFNLPTPSPQMIPVW